MNIYKVAVARTLLEGGPIFVRFCPQSDAFDCQVPPHLRLKDDVSFMFGRNLPVAIPDMTVTDLGIGGTLNFKGTRIWCWVPWECVFAVYRANLDNTSGGLGGLWWADAPASVREKHEKWKKENARKVISLADYKAAKSAAGGCK